MIDMHSHILPGIDDGAQSLDESLQMLRIAAADGVTAQVLTPHIHIGRYPNTKASLAESFALPCGPAMLQCGYRNRRAQRAPNPPRPRWRGPGRGKRSWRERLELSGVTPAPWSLVEPGDPHLSNGYWKCPGPRGG